MIGDVEKSIRRHFPNKWKEKNIKKLIGSPVFSLDINALQNSLNKPIRDFVLRGGKRIRPVLFLTILKIFGVNYKKYIDYAYLIELVHNGTLVIDDIEDNSKMRRGRPSMHEIFGLDTGINAGVSMHFIPLSILLNSKNITKSQKLRIYEIYSEELINVHFGQAIDIHWHKRNRKNIDINKYLEMCRLKTGSLMRMGARIACAIGNKSKKIEDLYKDFAETAGIAFQIRDDVLDLVGDEKKFGKKIGNDITEGKLSLPVIYARKGLLAKERKRLDKILSMHTEDRKLIQEARKLILKTKSEEKSIKYAKALFLKSWHKLKKEIPNKKNQKLLEDLTSFFILREY